jgi:hypothetical protein
MAARQRSRLLQAGGNRRFPQPTQKSRTLAARWLKCAAEQNAEITGLWKDETTELANVPCGSAVTMPNRRQRPLIAALRLQGHER